MNQYEDMVNIKAACNRANQLINSERRRRKQKPVRWSREMYNYAKEQADVMARAGRLIHSHRYALKGGENCWGGKGYFATGSEQLAKTMVNGWMSSPLHRAWLLDSRVKSAAVAIAVSRLGTFAAWAFCDSSPVSDTHSGQGHVRLKGMPKRNNIVHKLNTWFKKLLDF